MNEELESTLIAGNIVKFVYLDPTGDRLKHAYPVDTGWRFGV